MARILIVDDDENILNQVKTFLSHRDHEVIAVKDGYEAIDTLDRIKCDLALIDINMPHINGFSLVTSLRQKLQHKFLPIAFLTSRASQRDVERALKTGIDYYLVKPIIKDIFIDRIEALLANAPKRNKLEYNFDTKIPAKAYAELIGEIENISEMGIIFITKNAVTENQEVIVNSPLFSEFDLQDVKFIVNAVINNNHGEKRVHLRFKKIDFESINQIKVWIERKNTGRS